MPAKNTRLTTIIAEHLAEWLKKRSEDEERFWAAEGEDRLATFDREKAVSHQKAWCLPP